MATDIGFIGLGDMGFPMARRLLKHGFQVFSCAHRRREAIETLKAEGLIEKSTPREVAERVDVLITIVVDDQQTDAVLRGDSGALAGMKPGSTLIIMSTLSPTYCINIAKEAAELGLTVLDCPVSGGNIGAEKGTLALIVGGDVEATERCRAALEVMGTIHYCGDVGMGQVAKLANNAISLTTAAVVGEACAMARSYGMDMDRLMEILSKSTGQSFIADNWGRATSNWPHLRDLGHKDVGLCIETAKVNNVSLPLIEMRHGQDWTPNPGEF
jgi:3-hydroxyisobutyrate dehydrogenase-like beta-hydroxyacid dehydrogenase